MKKVSEMNGNEKIAWRNIKGVFDWEVGGWYNCIQDDCTEYIPDTYEKAFALIYEEAMNDAAIGGCYIVGRAPKEMRFAVEEFIEECLAHLFRTDGDAKEIAEVKEWDTTKEQMFEIIKVKIMGQLDYMKQLIAALENRVRSIPEEDNAKHAQLVQDLEEAVSEASRAVQKAARVGYI